MAKGFPEAGMSKEQGDDRGLPKNKTRCPECDRVILKRNEKHRYSADCQSTVAINRMYRQGMHAVTECHAAILEAAQIPVVRTPTRVVWDSVPVPTSRIFDHNNGPYTTGWLYTKRVILEPWVSWNAYKAIKETTGIGLARSTRLKVLQAFTGPNSEMVWDAYQTYLRLDDPLSKGNYTWLTDKQKAKRRFFQALAKGE
jgi:hypothetical protein